MNVDVAVPPAAPRPDDRVFKQLAPDLGARDPVDGKAMGVLEHHYRAPSDLVRLTRNPEAPELGRRVRVAPGERTGRWTDRRRDLRQRLSRHRRVRRLPAERQITGLCEKLLQSQEACPGDIPANGAGSPKGSS